MITYNASSIYNLFFKHYTFKPFMFLTEYSIIIDKNYNWHFGKCNYKKSLLH